MENLVAVAAHTANAHDTKAGVLAAQKAKTSYDQKFYADVDSRKSFDEDVQTWSLALTFPNASHPDGEFYPSAGYGSLKRHNPSANLPSNIEQDAQMLYNWLKDFDYAAYNQRIFVCFLRRTNESLVLFRVFLE